MNVLCRRSCLVSYAEAAAVRLPNHAYIAFSVQLTSCPPSTTSTKCRSGTAPSPAVGALAGWLAAGGRWWQHFGGGAACGGGAVWLTVQTVSRQHG